MRKIASEHFKKLLAVSLALAVVLCAGCKGKSDTASSEPAPAQPDISDEQSGFSYSAALDDRGFWKGIKALDLVNLCDYSKISIPSAVHTVATQELDAEVVELLSCYTTSDTVTDRAIEDGDTVNIDYVGTVDDIAFDGGSTGGAGTDVTIGVTSYIDNFLEQLIGHTPGDSFDIHVTFPENYGVDNLNGRKAVFATTVNHIVEYSTPELTDEFISENFAEPYGWKNVEQMKATIHDDLQKIAVDRFLRDYIAENCTTENLPEEIVSHQELSMVDFYKGYAQSYGVAFEQFLQMFLGVSDEAELIESNKPANEKAAQLYLFLQAIAEDAGLEAADGDVADYFKKRMYMDDYSDYEVRYGMPYLKLTVLNNMVLEHLRDAAVLEQA
jgi:trigger factor